MKKKIKITESQYNKLQQRLMETPFDQLAKSNIKVGDIIQVTKSGKKLKFKVLASYGGEIVMDGLSSEVENFRYTLTASSLEGNKLDGHYIDKTKNQIIPTDKKTWPVFNLGIQDFQVFRNNQIVDAADINGQSSFTPPKAPEPAPVVKPTPAPEETPSAEEEKPSAEETESYEQMINNINAELKGDEIFKQALFKQPTFWDRLKGEMNGTTPKGRGIIIANQLANSRKDKVSNEMLGANFKQGNNASFKIFTNVELDYNIDNKSDIVSFIIGGGKKAMVGETNSKNQRILYNKNKRFNIIVSENISTEKIPNLFLCYVSSYSTIKGNEINNEEEEPIKLQFIDSPGFKSNDK